MTAAKRGKRAILLVVVAGITSAVLLSGQAMAVGPVKIAAAYYQVSGASIPPTNAQLNQEYIVIRNGGSTAVSMGGWTLRDLARPTTPSHVFRFPTFRLGAGRSVRIHTGRGSNSSTDLYWGLTYFVWGDDSDTATLKNSAGTTESTCAWGITSTSPHYC